MTAAPTVAERYNNAAIAYRFAAEQAVEKIGTFAIHPTPATRTEFEQACGGYIIAQFALFDLQLERVNEAVGTGQLARVIGEQLEAKVAVLEEAIVEMRDELRHLSGLIATLIERLPEPGQPWRNEP